MDNWCCFALGGLLVWGFHQFRKVMHYDPYPDPPRWNAPVRWPPEPPPGVEPFDSFGKVK